MFKGFKVSRLTAAAVVAFALLVSLAPSTAAQGATATQSTSQAPQTPPPQAIKPAEASSRTGTQVASTPAAETVAAKAAAEPLYREYRGVKLGMGAAGVRAKLGKPQEKSDVMDFFVFNDRERARVYYTGGTA